MSDLVTTARSFAPALRARAAEGEELRTMPPDLVAQLKAAGLFRLALPAALGGWETDPLTLFEVIEELSSADGSSGWTVLIGNSTLLLSWLDPDVARKLLDGNPDKSSTGMFAPLGRAVPDGAGAFVVDGQWPCNSGCPHSELLVAGVHVMDGGSPRMLPSGRADWRFAFLARDDVEILDTWHAAGLRGTGSHDIRVDGGRVPEEWTCAPLFEPAHHDGPLYRLSFYNLLSCMMAGFPAGVARHALDTFIERAQTKRRGPAASTIADDEVVQVAVARADGARRAARSFFVDAMGDAWQTVVAGDECTLHQRALVLNATHALLAAAVTATEGLLPLAGSAAVYDDDPLQRCTRDILAARQHLYFSPDAVKRIGRVLLGVDQPTFML